MNNVNGYQGDVTGKNINKSYRNFKVLGVKSKLKIKKQIIHCINLKTEGTT